MNQQKRHWRVSRVTCKEVNAEINILRVEASLDWIGAVTFITP